MEKCKKILLILLIIIIVTLICVKVNLVNTLGVSGKIFQSKSEFENAQNIQIISNTSTPEVTEYKGENFSQNYDTKVSNSYTVENIDTSTNNGNKYEKIDLSNRSVENVFVEVKQETVSESGATMIITDNNEVAYTWDPDIYRIEKKINGEWKDINPNREFDSLMIGYR